MARILLIDDDPQIIRLLKKYLEFMGHILVTASNGKEGLNMLAVGTFDLLITDMIMPERDGIEVLMAVRKMPVRPKTIAMTGGSPNLDQKQLMQMAALMKSDRVLAKPIDLPNLSQIIKELLESP